MFEDLNVAEKEGSWMCKNEWQVRFRLSRAW